MHLDWILNPSAAGLAVFAGLGLALVLVTFLISTAKIRIRTAGLAATPPSEFEEVRRRLADLEERRAAPAPDAFSAVPVSADTPPVSVRPGMNLSHRSQALRLARRGESPEQIASILGLATGEVRLLLKIHGILMRQAVTVRPRNPLKPGQESADILGSADKVHARAAKPV